MSNQTFHFKSSTNIFFYLGIAFVLLILAFTSYNLFRRELTVGSFLILNVIALSISYAVAFRFTCSIHLTEKGFKSNYYFKDERNLFIAAGDILAFSKDADTVHRYFKRLLIVTSKETFLIRYNITDKSDEDMVNLLNLIVEENKLRQTNIGQKSD